MKTWQEDTLDAIVRDATKVGSIPKSELRSRIENLIASEKARWIEETKHEIVAMGQRAVQAYDRLPFVFFNTPSDEMKELLIYAKGIEDAAHVVGHKISENTGDLGSPKH